MTTKSLTVPVLVGLLVLILVTGSSPLVAGADDPLTAAAGDSPTARYLGTLTLGSHGSAWVPQVRGKFALWRPYGWGTATRVTLAGVGDQWVHIQVPAASFFDESLTTLWSAQFCARSSNGARTKPIQIDIWNGTSRIYSAPIAWNGDNLDHCWEVGFTPPLWAETVGISVLLRFANSTDQITLEGASASFWYG